MDGHEPDNPESLSPPSDAEVLLTRYQEALQHGDVAQVQETAMRFFALACEQAHAEPTKEAR